MSLFTFHFVLIPLRGVWIQLSSLKNSWADWLYNLSLTTSLGEGKLDQAWYGSLNIITINQRWSRSTSRYHQALLPFWHMFHFWRRHPNLAKISKNMGKTSIFHFEKKYMVFHKGYKPKYKREELCTYNIYETRFVWYVNLTAFQPNVAQLMPNV